MPPRCLVSIATYNERENLAALVPAVRKELPQADILVVDDHSPDGTGQLADELAAQDGHVHVLHRQGKLGLGTAIIAAMKYAIEHAYDYHLNMDADFSHHPRYLPALYEGMDRADVTIGSRYVPGGGVVNWSWKRRLMSRAVNVLARVTLRLAAHDTSGAYRCYRVEKLKQIDLDHIWSRGYSFQEEMLYRCQRVGCRFWETPIIFEDRRLGSSKVSLKESVRSMGTLLLLGVYAMFGWEK